MEQTNIASQIGGEIISATQGGGDDSPSFFFFLNLTGGLGAIFSNFISARLVMRDNFYYSGVGYVNYWSWPLIFLNFMQ